MNYYTVYQCPFSKIYLKSDGLVLTGLYFEQTKNFEKIFKDCKFSNSDIFNSTIKWLDLYFSGQIPSFTPEYKIENATPFRLEVIDIMSQIPYGKLVTYNDISKQIAKDYGIKKMSAQAVGGAVGWNPICIIIPCHRVVGSNNSLTCYTGGVENKIKLLEIEGHTF